MFIDWFFFVLVVREVMLHNIAYHVAASYVCVVWDKGVRRIPFWRWSLGDGPIGRSGRITLEVCVHFFEAGHIRRYLLYFHGKVTIRSGDLPELALWFILKRRRNVTSNSDFVFNES